MKLDGIEAWLTPTEELTLNNCDREAIHIPNLIQPHGAMLVLSRERALVQYSQNLESFFRVKDAQSLREALTSCFDEHMNQPKRYTSLFNLGGRPFSVVSHRMDAQRIFEFERLDEQTSFHLISLVNQANDSFSNASSTREIYEVAVEYVRKVNGFDRVLAYAFSADGHGEVVAEARDEGSSSFLNLRFPGTDIPKQARRLYVLEQTRLIADVSYEPVPIAPTVNPLTNKSLNMAFCQLRSVSPVHIEYLKNMGVHASFSASIVIDDELIGLIACHHNSPRHINFQRRQACEAIGRLASTALKQQHERELREMRSRQLSVQVKLLSELGDESTLKIDSKAWSLAVQFIDSEALFVSINGETAIFGDSDESTSPLVWAIGDRLSRENTQRVRSVVNMQKYDDRVEGGLLVIPITGQGWLGWYRQPEHRLVKWGGQPTSDEDLKTLTPRASFDIWRQEISGESRAWLIEEEEMGEILSRGLSARFGETEAQNQNAFEQAMRQMRAYVMYLEESNLALHRVNDDLRQFAYAASHDLRAPLRTIRSFLPMVDRKISTDQTKAKTWIAYVSNAADTLHRLQEGLWTFSRVNRENSTSMIDTRDVINRLIASLASDLQEAHVVVGEMPTIDCVPEQLETLLRNLIDNAVKYKSPDRPLHLVIDAKQAHSEWVFSVSDNGVGFPPSAHERIFDLFSRVHSDHADGDGLGLALCRRIVHHHQGWIRASSAPGQGSTFEFCLKTPKLISPEQFRANL